VTGRRGKRRRQLTDDNKEKIGYRRLKEEELDGKRSLEEAVDMSQYRTRKIRKEKLTCRTVRRMTKQVGIPREGVLRKVLR
jgi:hypothetical protein